MNTALYNFISDELKINLNNIKIISKLNGLSNFCYKVTYLSKPYFIRIFNNNINNLNSEKEIILLCSKQNIGPELYYFSNTSGNMMTSWINGDLPSQDEFSSSCFIDKLVYKLKMLHNLNSKNHFNPFNEIITNINLCLTLSIELPPYINKLISKLKEIESYCSRNIDYGLCHNDLNPSNILISNNDIFLIDYEFSGMGDIFFDLATLTWMMSEQGSEILLNTYFENLTQYHYKKLSYYLFVVKFWNATWSLLKSQNPNCAYDYKKGAEIILEDLYNTSFSL